MTTSWCPDCHARQEVEETSIEGEQTRRGEIAYAVTRLACGHSVQGPGTVIAAAPGAPYAGPQVVVATTPRLRDQQAARARQLAVDADPFLEGGES